MEYKDPNGDFKSIAEMVQCPVCGWESSVTDLDDSFKVRCCDLCGHDIQL